MNDERYWEEDFVKLANKKKDKWLPRQELFDLITEIEDEAYERGGKEVMYLMTGVRG